MESHLVLFFRHFLLLQLNMCAYDIPKRITMSGYLWNTFIAEFNRIEKNEGAVVISQQGKHLYPCAHLAVGEMMSITRE